MNRMCSNVVIVLGIADGNVQGPNIVVQGSGWCSSIECEEENRDHVKPQQRPCRISFARA